MVHEWAQLKTLGEKHFSTLYMDDGSASILEQLKVIKLFPFFFSAEDADFMGAEVLMVEVETTLKSFKKDKTLGLDS